jgi:hypothetical protein
MTTDTLVHTKLIGNGTYKTALDPRILIYLTQNQTYLSTP